MSTAEATAARAARGAERGSWLRRLLLSEYLVLLLTALYVAGHGRRSRPRSSRSTPGATSWAP